MKKNELEFESEDLITILTKINNKSQMFDFLLDILSEKEILKLSEKLSIAKMLEQGISYSRIEKKTGMSSATIAKISKSLNGENFGLKNAINILSGEY